MAMSSGMTKPPVDIAVALGVCALMLIRAEEKIPPNYKDRGERNVAALRSGFLLRNFVQPCLLFECRYDQAPIREFVGAALFEKFGGTPSCELESVASVASNELLCELNGHQSRQWMRQVENFGRKFQRRRRRADRQWTGRGSSPRHGTPLRWRNVNLVPSQRGNWSN